MAEILDFATKFREKHPSRIDGDAIRREAEAQLAEASAKCDAILAHPSTWWLRQLEQTPNTQTVVMAQELVGRVPAMLDNRPEDALLLTSMALRIVAKFHPAQDPSGMAMVIRGIALRDRAYVLSHLGRFREALDSAIRCGLALEASMEGDATHTAATLVQIPALRALNRPDRAARLASKAARTLAQLFDARLYTAARRIQATLLSEIGEDERAQNIRASLFRGPIPLPAPEPTLAQELAALYWSERESPDLPTDPPHILWLCGKGLWKDDLYPEVALDQLRDAWPQLTLQNPIEGALAALDLVEALVRLREWPEAGEICDQLIRQLTKARLPSRVVTAVSLLRKAIDLRVPSVELVQGVRGVVWWAGGGPKGP